MLISRLRRKIEPDPRVPRLIVTMPGEGYRFSVKPQAASRLTVVPAGRSIELAPVGDVSAGRDRTSVAPFDPRRSIGGRRTSLLERAAALAIAAGLIFAFWHPATRTALVPVGQKFDASDVPLVGEDVRAEMASYSAQPDSKAVAISADGWGTAVGAPSPEIATREALERCRARTKAVTVCRVYAVGTDVVWPRDSLPLPRPADLRTELLDLRFVAAEIPTFGDARRRQIEDYVKAPEHKALAISKRGNALWRSASSSRADAARTTVERCGDFYQVACLLVSIDGMLTVQIPKSRRVEDIFMLTTAAEMTEQVRQQVEQVYRDKEWRALARGKSGGWYPVANAPSESAAVETALELCGKNDSDCSLYAIGNFRVIETR
jgi:hypothetical protein